jgi:hypothetical protein
MIVTFDLSKDEEKTRKEYAWHFLWRTGDIGKLQAMRAGRLPAGEVLRLAIHERELRLRAVRAR